MSFVQHANNRREFFGEVSYLGSILFSAIRSISPSHHHRKGFTFLNIPRSYYGTLTVEILAKGIACNGSNRPDGLLTEECASAVFEACRASGLVNDDSAVDLDATADSIRVIISEKVPRKHLDAVIETILRSRYVNLLKLLGVRLSSKWNSFHNTISFPTLTTPTYF